MPQVIRLKKSAVAGKAPAVADLELGEIALNTHDGKLFMKRDNGTASIVEIGAGAGGLLASNNLSDLANAATARTNIGLGTAAAPEFVGVNIGHASDTTLTRVSAGVAAIEGRTISLLSAAETITATKTFATMPILDAGSGSANLTLRSYLGGGNYGSTITFTDAGSGGATCRLESIANALEFRVSLVSGNYYAFSPNSSGFRPSVDNNWSLGGASNRWGNIFAGNGTIVTSDQRDKSALIPITAEMRALARAIFSRVGVFQFLASIEEKGPELARRHIGLSAQDVMACCEEAGIDGFRYGFIGRDPIFETYVEEVEDGVDWVDEMAAREESVQESVFDVTVGAGITRTITRTVIEPVYRDVPILDQDGNPILDPESGLAQMRKVRSVISSPRIVRRPQQRPIMEGDAQKTRLSLRYDQLCNLALCALSHEIESLRASVAALEARLPHGD